MKISVTEAAAKAITAMGGPVATARELGVDNYQTVQSWAKNGIPASYCIRVEKLSGVSRQELRAEDWRDYWPDLAAGGTKKRSTTQAA